MVIFGIIYSLKIYVSWKYQKENPCVAILSKQKCRFFLLSFGKSDNRREKQVLHGEG
jgi:hypothetical protein